MDESRQEAAGSLRREVCENQQNGSRQSDLLDNATTKERAAASLYDRIVARTEWHGIRKRAHAESVDASRMQCLVHRWDSLVRAWQDFWAIQLGQEANSLWLCSSLRHKFQEFIGWGHGHQGQ
jgi:hypothetical protein